MKLLLFDVLIAWFVTLIFIDSGLAADIDPVCLKQVMSAGRTAWRKAADHAQDIEIVCLERASMRDLTGKRPVDNTPSKWLISWSMAKDRHLVDHIYLEDNNHAIHAGNPRYRFTVGADTLQQPSYKLASAVLNKTSSNVPPYDAAEQVALEQILGASYHVAGLSLQNLMTGQDGVNLIGAEFFKRDEHDDRPVRLEWECVIDLGNMARKGTHYWAELDPASWLIIRCGLNNPDGGKLLKTIEYQDYAGEPFPKLVNEKFTQPKIYDESRTYRYENPHPCTRSNDEFYLPYYGFPESVVDVTRASSWVRTAAIVLSLIGVAVSIYLYRMSRKPGGPKVAPG